MRLEYWKINRYTVDWSLPWSNKWFDFYFYFYLSRCSFKLMQIQVIDNLSSIMCQPYWVFHKELQLQSTWYIMMNWWETLCLYHFYFLDNIWGCFSFWGNKCRGVFAAGTSSSFFHHISLVSSCYALFFVNDLSLCFFFLFFSFLFLFSFLHST